MPTSRVTGRYVALTRGGRPLAFVPAPLPPVPGLAIDADLRAQFDAALLALGRLDSISTLLPIPDLFLYSYVRKEALVSSQIEGTQSSLSDLLLFEVDVAPGVPFVDVVEVSNYVAALEEGLRKLKSGMPLSNRLIRDIHAILLRRGRGADKQPGEFRRVQNWLGGPSPETAVFVPPPAQEIARAMAALERFLHDEPERTSPLIKAGLAHVQFETIHPFLDGNGRVGRLLVPLILHVEAVLTHPLLYLSLYFKQHRSEYYERLGRVRTDGDWEGWMRFFARGVIETAEHAVSTARRMTAMVERDRERVQQVGRGAPTALQVHETMQREPITTIPRLAARTRLSVPGATAGLERLVALGIVRELSGRQRRRVYSYVEYVALLSEGTEPL